MQSLVWLNGGESFLLEGDPEREDPRFWRTTEGTARFGQPLAVQRAGQALPVLLSEGWQIVAVVGIGMGQSHVLVRTEALPAGRQ